METVKFSFLLTFPIFVLFYEVDVELNNYKRAKGSNYLNVDVTQIHMRISREVSVDFL